MEELPVLSYFLVLDLSYMDYEALPQAVDQRISLASK